MHGEWATISEVVALTGIDRQRLQRACRAGRIRCQRTGALWLVHTDELEKLTKQNRP